MKERGKVMENEMIELYQKEIERMEKQGYTEPEIERALDLMIRVQNMVTMAVM